MSKPVALKLMIKPLRHDLLEDGYERYVSPRQKVEVYFRKGTRGVAVVTTWTGSFRPTRADRAVHDDRRAEAGLPYRLKAFHQGLGTPAYRLGNLVFTVKAASASAQSGSAVGTAAPTWTLNVAPCR